MTQIRVFWNACPIRFWWLMIVILTETKAQTLGPGLETDTKTPPSIVSLNSTKVGAECTPDMHSTWYSLGRYCYEMYYSGKDVSTFVNDIRDKPYMTFRDLLEAEAIVTNCCYTYAIECSCTGIETVLKRFRRFEDAGSRLNPLRLTTLLSLIVLSNLFWQGQLIRPH